MKEYTLSETQRIVHDELTTGLEGVLRRGAQQMLFTFYDFPAQHWQHLRSDGKILVLDLPILGL